MSQLFTNNAITTLANAVTSSGQTSLTLVSGKGALFPNPVSPDFFLITLDDGVHVEILRCTSRSTDVLTVVRAQEGTTAQSSFAIGTKAELRLTAESIWPRANVIQVAQAYSPGVSGTATLNLSLSNIHEVSMPAGNITVDVSNAKDSQCFMIAITQDSVGSRLVTWFSTIRWAGGTAPTLTTTASKRDTFGFRRTGNGTYDGFVIGKGC